VVELMTTGGLERNGRADNGARSPDSGREG
jgi:hypothetical protein